jgi:hypothetical protein
MYPRTAKVPAIVKIPPPTFFSFKINFQSPVFYRSVIRNRGSTFLQNCVFRI